MAKNLTFKGEEGRGSVRGPSQYGIAGMFAGPGP
jgi:hypothetical protein